VTRFRRPVRDGLVIAGLLYLGYRFIVLAPIEGTVGADAWAYWMLDPSNPYALPNGVYGAFLYPPPMVRAFTPAALLSWPQFWLLWTGVLVATAIWLGGRRALFVLAFPPVALELYFGNVNLLIAAAIALGFRYPAAWAFVLLTKVTPGIGLIWFIVRREWRHLGIALGVTAALVVVSLVIDLPLWAQWLDALRRDSGATLGGPFASPLWLRFPIAAIVVVWGARTDRAWTVPVAATIAMPVVWLATLSVLTAAVASRRPVLQPGRSDRRAPSRSA
jgi:hypothetical protein